MARLSQFCALVVWGSLCISSTLRAQANPDTALTKLVQYAIPSAPALGFIGASSEKIVRPTAPKEVAMLLANGIDAAGKVLQGLAIEVAPGQLLMPTMDRAHYESFFGYLVANAAISLGTVKSAGDSSSTNVGLGARATLFDRSDAYAASATSEMGDAFRAALRNCQPPGSGPLTGNATKIAQFRKCFAAADSAAHADFRRNHWNDWALTVSWATGMQLAGSAWNARRAMGNSVSAVLAAPLCIASSSSRLCRHGQWLVQAGYEDRDSISGAPRSTSRSLFGARGTLGTDTFGAFGEYLSLTRISRGATLDRKSAREWSAGLEFKVTDQLWATTGFGSRYLAVTGETKAVVLAGLRLNLNKDRKLGFIPSVQ